MKKGGLGSIPKCLSWIDQVETDTQVIPAKEETAPIVKCTKEMALQPEHEAKIKSTQKGLPAGWTRATFIVDRNLNEKIKALANWERLTEKEIVNEALERHLQGRNIKPIPKKAMANNAPRIE